MQILMKVTCEISLYPLLENYESLIIATINYLKHQKDIEVLTHAMSTFIKGDSSSVFLALQNLYKEEFFISNKHALVIKIINSNLPVESGFLNFK